MSTRRFSHVIGFDDAPFERSHRGDVLVVGAVYAWQRLEGVLSGQVRRDGSNATDNLAALTRSSRFFPHLKAVLLQGITLAGFNVVDIHALSRQLELPVLVVCRHQPDLPRIRRALLEKVPDGEQKWALIEQAGTMEALHGRYVQRAGLSQAEAAQLLHDYADNGLMPEPLRTAHMIAGGIATGESRHRV